MGGKRLYTDEERKQKRKEATKKYRETHKEQIKKLFEENKDKYKLTQKEYYENNKENILKRQKKHYEEYKEEILERQKEYYENNKEEILEKCSIYRKSNGAIKEKLSSSRESDVMYNREFNIDEEYVKELLENQNYKCSRCNINVKMEWTENKDLEQFSINRLDNKIGHIKGNCEITCWGCNLKYKRR